ncbi:alpha/beta hydrolase [Pseudolysinimonas sp.]|uniref:alpha/beta hydrolase n=1 Tax=Pseudolysinimonas sp. TaxID=2680009 RepID=UPI003F81DE1E
MSSPASRRLGWFLGGAAAAVAIGRVAANSSPWAAALLIRAVFDRGAARTRAEFERHPPKGPVDELRDIPYGDDPDMRLDVFGPAGVEGPLPTVVWIHGGAWISGSKDDVAPYLRILAAEGFRAIGLDYTVAPEATYPTAVRQLGEALRHVRDHAAELGVDPARLVLAGDSAGAQLASQLAVLMTNPEYAALIGMEPPLGSTQLTGVILHCGVYDLRRMASLTGVAAWGFKSALWAYTGTRNWSSSYQGSTMSTIDFVTSGFPPVYISGGNGDGLTWIESIPMSQALERAGVDTTTRFYAADHEPSLPHEYQFHLDFAEAEEALQDTLAFLHRVTR